MNIYVGNLSFDTTSDSLNQLFSSHGNVSSARVVTDRDTNRSKGFAFVEMDDDAEAHSAIEALRDYELDGRTLRINEAKPREQRSFSNRGGGNRGGNRGFYN